MIELVEIGPFMPISARSSSLGSKTFGTKVRTPHEVQIHLWIIFKSNITTCVSGLGIVAIMDLGSLVQVLLLSVVVREHQEVGFESGQFSCSICLM